MSVERLRGFLERWRLLLELVLVAFFIGYGLVHRQDLGDILGRLALPGLLGCMLLYGVAMLLAPLGTRLLLGTLGHALPYRRLLGIHLLCLPAKYLPGGIWHTVGRGAELVRDGIPARRIGELLLAEQLLALWWSGALGLLLALFAFDGESRRLFLLLELLWLLVPGLLLVWLCRRTAYAHLVRGALLPQIWLVFSVGWCCLAAAFVLYLVMGGVVQDNVLQVAAGYLLSWMLGALVIFAPQGMGVFELAMTRVLSDVQAPVGGLLWYLGSYRLVVLLADLVAWGIWKLSSRRRVRVAAER